MCRLREPWYILGDRSKTSRGFSRIATDKLEYCHSEPLVAEGESASRNLLLASPPKKMKPGMGRFVIAVMTGLFIAAFTGNQCSAQSFAGFDRNEYPGDINLKSLRQTFSFAGYWLNDPPGEKRNTWIGKRTAVESAGLGFLVLFNGRLYAELKSVARAKALGRSDAQAAVRAARREGFAQGIVIFLDQEQGGRMLPEQKSYIYAWVDGVTAAGDSAGIYCSGIGAKEDDETVVITADDIRQNSGSRKIMYFVTNDVCPPSPGCAFSNPPIPSKSGIDFADIWQFAQSPKRKDFTSGCPANYNPDGNCYPPGMNPAQRLHVDVDVSTSADPSHTHSTY